MKVLSEIQLLNLAKFKGSYLKLTQKLCFSTKKNKNYISVNKIWKYLCNRS